MSGRIRCPECGSRDVVCVPHPTAKRWHVFECQSCGHTGGDHRGQSILPINGTNWRENEDARP